MYSDRHIFPTHAAGSCILIFCEILCFNFCIVAARSSILSIFNVLYLYCCYTVSLFLFQIVLSFINNLEDTLSNTSFLVLVFFKFFSHTRFSCNYLVFNARYSIVNSV